MMKIRDIVKVTAGQAAPKKFSEKGIPFIRAGHLEDLVAGASLKSLPKVTEEVANKHRLKKIPKGTILFAKSGMSATKNRVYITEDEAYFVSHLAGILPSDKISNKYLAKYFYWYNPSRLILDDAYPSIRLEDINNLKIPIPPLAAQQKIAAILDEADKVRQLNKQLIEKYDALTQSLFLDMFGDPVTNPKGWEKVILEKMFYSKPRIGTIMPVSDDGKTKVVRVGELGAKSVRLESCKRVNLSKEEKGRFSLFENDLVLARAIGSIEHLGKASLIKDIKEDIVFDSHVMRLQFNQQKINSEFFYHWLKSHGGRTIFLKNSGQTAVQFNINSKQISRISIYQPTIILQNQFASSVQAIEQQKAQAKASLQKSEDLFNSLLQLAFKGELV